MEVLFYKSRHWHLSQHVNANTITGFPSLGKTEVKYFQKQETKVIQVCKQKDDCLALVPSEIREVIQDYPHSMVSGSLKLGKCELVKKM